MDGFTVVLPSKEHAASLLAFLDRAPVQGVKAKRCVVEIMEALETALREPQAGHAEALCGD